MFLAKVEARGGRTAYGFVTLTRSTAVVVTPFQNIPTVIPMFRREDRVTIEGQTLEEVWRSAGDPDLPYMDLAGDRYIRTDVKPENRSLPEGWNWEEPGWFMVGFGGIADFDYEQIWSTDLW